MLRVSGIRGQRRVTLEAFRLSKSCSLPSRDVSGVFTQKVLRVVMLAQKDAILGHPNGNSILRKEAKKEQTTGLGPAVRKSST